MGQRLLVLTGAPSADSLTWNDANLLTSLEPPFCIQTVKDTSKSRREETSLPVWRNIGLDYNGSRSDFGGIPKKKRKLSASTGIGSDFAFSSQGENVMASDRDNMSSAHGDSLDDFYEHSFTAHELSTAFLTSSSQESDDTWYSAEVDCSLPPERRSKAVPSDPLLTHLRDIPDSSYIRSIEPQTMTVNLIIGIVSVGMPKMIIARKSKRRLELVEMIVGDETGSGFRISLWLPEDSNDSHKANTLRDTVRRLQPHDILLGENIGLYTFKDSVHGQSLRKDLSGLRILHSKNTSKQGAQNLYTTSDLAREDSKDICLQRTIAVRNWMLKHVPSDTFATPKRSRRMGRQRGHLQNTLPLDTQ